MSDRSYKLTLSLSDGSTINAGTITAPQGPNGANGVTFTPSVSAAGVLSWTNNGGLTNPSPISIKGPKGDDAVITASDVENWGFTKNAMPKSGGTFTGEVKFGSTENFQGYYIKRMIGSLGAGTAYNNLDSLYKDGTYHRMWRLRFPSGSSFWGKIKVTLYGGYSSFNASGVMSKSITCNFNTSSIYNNVGCYDGLGVNVEQDFRISEAIWNSTASAWEVLIWQKNLSGNNSPTIMLECWTTNNTNYINAFNDIAKQPVELTQSTSYSAQKASPTGGTKTVTWETLPVYENPLGEEIATIGDLSNKANLSGGNTFTGKQTLNSPGSDGYSINAAGYVKGSWLQASAIANKGANTGKICVFDNSGWIYYRTPSEILTEAGGAKTSDIPDVSGKANLNGENTFTGKQLFNNTVGGVTNQLALNETQWDIFTCRDLTSPTTKTAVGKGFVWCQDNDSIYSQFKATGIYYGNDTSGYEGTLKFPTNISGEKTIATTDQIPDVNSKANLSGENIFIGRQAIAIDTTGYVFNVWTDTQDTGTVFGVEKIGSGYSGASRIHIDGDALGNVDLEIGGDAGTSGQVLTSQGSGKTPIWKELVTLDTIQDITGNKTFTTSQSGGPKIGIYNGRLSVRSSSTSEGGIIWNTPSDNIAADFTVDGNGAHLSLGVDAAADIVLNGDSGIAGQVLTSQGSNTTPQWKSIPTYSLSGTTLTITLP